LNPRLNKEAIFQIWAPPNAIWSPWAKPVLFAHVEYPTGPDVPAADVRWADRADGSTALVLDVPGTDAVAMAVPLARAGYRPVPLFNACPSTGGEITLVEVKPIVQTLVWASPELLAVGLAFDAPPVFLLDSNRRTGLLSPAPGLFDNRSISLPTDFPSANLLLSRGIRRVVLVQAVSQSPQADLSHTLRRWQDGGIEIFSKALDRADPADRIIVQTPRAFRTLWYNLLATIGLRSSPLGGFGGILPVPSAG